MVKPETSPEQRTVYFAGAIKGDTSYAYAQDAIIGAIRNTWLGNRKIRVWSELSEDAKPYVEGKTPAQVFRRDCDWLNESDALVAEVSGESFGVGCEVAYAQHVLGIPVLCLVHESAKLPTILSGNTHEGLQVSSYSSARDIQQIIGEFFDSLEARARNERSRVWRRVKSPPNVVVRATATPFDNTEAAISLTNPRLRVAGVLTRRRREADTDLTEALRALAAPEDVELSGRSISAGLTSKSVENPKTAFRRAVQSIEAREHTVLVSEASAPSTDLGWLVCYAQWKNCPVVLAARNDSNLSWMLIGQLPSPQLDDAFTNWTMRIDDEPRSLEWRSTKGRSRDNRRRYRHRLLLVRYDDPISLQDELVRALEFIAKQYNQVPLARRLDDFAGSDASESDVGLTTRFLAECALRQVLWNSEFTRAGIDGSFVRGELGRLLPLLTRVTPCSSPRALYARVRLLVNYEEKALAKNVKALKDIGILVRRQTRSRLSLQRSHQAAIPEGDETLAGFASQSGKRRRQEVVGREVVLTPFGHRLSLFLGERESMREDFESFLRHAGEECALLFGDQVRQLQRLKHPHYYLDELDDDSRAALEAIVKEHGKHLIRTGRDSGGEDADCSDGVANSGIQREDAQG